MGTLSTGSSRQLPARADPACSCPYSTDSSISGFTIAGIIAASLAVLLLLSLPFYLKARRRKRRNTNVGDAENRGSLPASYETGNHGGVSLSFPSDRGDF
jgi:hypothetical protein